MMPFLSKMSSAHRVVTHSDEDGQYVVTVKPGAGMVAAFGLTLLSDEAWPEDPCESDDFRASSEGVLQAQRLKAMHPLVFDELKKLQDMAERSKVPRENVLLVDCGAARTTPDVVAAQARDALERDVPFATVRANALWPELGNKVGLCLTDVFLDEIWDMGREERGDVF